MLALRIFRLFENAAIRHRLGTELPVLASASKA
jgi:hypothetical protein